MKYNSCQIKFLSNPQSAVFKNNNNINNNNNNNNNNKTIAELNNRCQLSLIPALSKDFIVN